MCTAEFLPNLTLKRGQAIAQTTTSPVNEIQVVTEAGGTASGTWTWTALGQTVVVDWNTTAAALQALLETIYGVGNVTCADGDLDDGVIHVTYQGFYAGLDMPLPVIDYSGLDAGTVVVTEGTKGVSSGRWGAYNQSASNGLQTPKAFTRRAVSTDEFGLATEGPAADGDEHGLKHETLPVFYVGYFDVDDLTKDGVNPIDATLISRLGARVAPGNILILPGA